MITSVARSYGVLFVHVPPSFSFKSNGDLPAGPTYRWDSLAYEALIDRDNTAIVFVKGDCGTTGLVSQSRPIRAEANSGARGDGGVHL